MSQGAPHNPPTIDETMSELWSLFAAVRADPDALAEFFLLLDRPQFQAFAEDHVANLRPIGPDSGSYDFTFRSFILPELMRRAFPEPADQGAQRP